MKTQDIDPIAIYKLKNEDNQPVVFISSKYGISERSVYKLLNKASVILGIEPTKRKKWSEESKAKIRKPKSKLHKENIAKGRAGYKPKEESINKWKQSIELTGFSHLKTSEYRDKMSNIMRGKVKSDSHRQKMSELMKLRPYNNYKRGFYYSQKAGSVFYRSSLELKSYIILDSEPKVLNFVVEPCRIIYLFDNEERLYIPDLKIFYIDNEISIAEIKREEEINWGINVAKFKAAEEYCSRNKIKFEIITETYLNDVIAKQGELLGTLYLYLNKDNQQPSSSNVANSVDEKVQRLMDEDATN